MIDPLRLADSTDSAVARAMLRSARRDQAPADTPAKVAAAVGIALPALATAAVTKSAVAAAGTGSVGTWFGAFSAVSTLKVAVLSFVVSGAALGVGIGRELGRRAAPPPHSSASTVVHSGRATAVAKSPPPRRAGPAASALPAGPGESPSSLRAAPATTPHVAAKGQGKRHPTETGASPENDPSVRGVELERPMAPAVGAPLPTAAFANVEPTAEKDSAEQDSGATGTRASTATQRLEREVAMLDAARRALAQGRSAEALALLDRHRAEFSGGALYPESIILRVQALLAKGRRAAAEREAQPILVAAPRSRAADALRALLIE